MKSRFEIFGRLLCKLGIHKSAVHYRHRIDMPDLLHCARCWKILAYVWPPPKHPNCRCRIEEEEEVPF